MNLPTNPIKITPNNIDKLRKQGLIKLSSDILNELNASKKPNDRVKAYKDLKWAIRELGFLPEDFLAPFRLKNGKVYIFDTKTAEKIKQKMLEKRYEERTILEEENGKLKKTKIKIKRW